MLSKLFPGELLALADDVWQRMGKYDISNSYGGFLKWGYPKIIHISSKEVWNWNFRVTDF